MAAIAYTPAGNAIFATAPLPLSAWLFMLPFAAAMLAAEELRKWLLKRGPSGRRRSGWESGTGRYA
jgi:hypothetical protein